MKILLDQGTPVPLRSTSLLFADEVHCRKQLAGVLGQSEKSLSSQNHVTAKRFEKVAGGQRSANHRFAMKPLIAP